jgi:hypothetical protein
MVPNQVHAVLSNVLRIWVLAKARKWLADNPLAGYRIPRAKEDRVTNVEEFTPAEARALMGQLSPKDSRRWRAHVCCRIAGTQGPGVGVHPLRRHTGSTLPMGPCEAGQELVQGFQKQT